MRPDSVNSFIGYVASNLGAPLYIVDDVSDDTSYVRVNDYHMTLSTEKQELSRVRIYFHNNGS
jgi:hypothetical protein